MAMASGRLRPVRAWIFSSSASSCAFVACTRASRSATVAWARASNSMRAARLRRPQRGGGLWVTLDLEEFGFFALQRVVDGVDVGLRERLQLLLRARHLVIAHLALQSVQVVLRAATDVADRDLGVLRLAAHDLHELLAA